MLKLPGYQFSNENGTLIMRLILVPTYVLALEGLSVRCESSWNSRSKLQAAYICIYIRTIIKNPASMEAMLPTGPGSCSSESIADWPGTNISTPLLFVLITQKAIILRSLKNSSCSTRLDNLQPHIHQSPCPAFSSKRSRWSSTFRSIRTSLE